MGSNPTSGIDNDGGSSLLPSIGVHVPGLNRRAAVLVSLAFVLSAATPPLASAQDAEPPSRNGLAWLTVGVGVGTAGGALALGPDVAWNNHILSGRASTTFRLKGPDYGDLGLLYGRTAVWEYGMVGVSAGLGVMQYHDYGYRSGEVVAVSVPVAARAAFQPLPVFGLGTYLFGNLNLERPFAGLVLTVNLGWLE